MSTALHYTSTLQNVSVIFYYKTDMFLDSIMIIIKQGRKHTCGCGGRPESVGPGVTPRKFLDFRTAVHEF